jgi:serine/threonine-protein kinase
VGAVAYYLLTGRPPFQGSTPMQIIVSHLRDTPAPPSEFVADIPADLEAVVLRCLEKLPGNRFTDAKDLAAALEACESYGSWSDDDAAAWWAEFARHEPIDLTQEERTEG